MSGYFRWRGGFEEPLEKSKQQKTVGIREKGNWGEGFPCELLIINPGGKLTASFNWPSATIPNNGRANAPTPQGAFPMSGSNIQVSGSGIELPPVIGDMYSPATLNSGSGTTPVTLVTGAPGYIITRLFVEVDATCTLASAGMLTINFTDTGSELVVGQYRVFIPAAFVAPTSPTGPQLATTGTGYWYRARTPNSSLQVSLSVALTAGSIRVAANYAIITQDS